MLVCAARRVLVRKKLSLCARGGCAEHFAELCSTLQKIAVSRDAKYRFRTFALSLDDKRTSATLAHPQFSIFNSQFSIYHKLFVPLQPEKNDPKNDAFQTP